MENMIAYFPEKIKNKNGKLKWFYFESLPIPPFLNQDNYNFIDDKFLLKKKCQKNVFKFVYKIVILSQDKL